jgi:type II secretory pathway pseudopilin PulG
VNASREAGTTLVEVLVVAAIGVLVLGAAFALFARVARAQARAQHAAMARAQAGRLEDRLRDDAANAWAIFVPKRDALGNANADGHELDFYAQDAERNAYLWGYDYDPGSESVTRYAYPAAGAAQPGEAFPGITAFAARAVGVNAPGDPASPAYDPLFAGDGAVPVVYSFGPDGPSGGNGFVSTRFAAGTTVVSETLSPATAPTHFTIVVDYTPSP